MPDAVQSPASQTQAPGFLSTERKDNWWIGPLATALGLGAFGVYATYRAWRGACYEWESLLSPFYSPLIVWKGMPAWLSPAFLILWAPGGFRLTCYYYRKAYYRAFFAHPYACAVGEGRSATYCGETRFPFLLQNLHRYFMYVAILFIFILWGDAFKAMFWKDGFHVSVGTLVLCLNSFLLMCYTLGCHSLRHLIGGKVDCFTCAAGGNARLALWKGATLLNVHHMFWAWVSLFWVGFSDFYVWMVASHRWTDIRLF